MCLSVRARSIPRCGSVPFAAPRIGLGVTDMHPSGAVAAIWLLRQNHHTVAQRPSNGPTTRRERGRGRWLSSYNAVHCTQATGGRAEALQLRIRLVERNFVVLARR